MQLGGERRHELSNLLTIALANVEAMIDGLAEPTQARLEAVADAIRRAAELIHET
ncbi:MAG: hypothetical protein JO078_11940 [Candidatus Eremiobacteraeota bacterium]|nr:hypothetical protein [Candidatus Eremiobacteraeota bacterium]MBV9700821.1 hypothetical protein [Candidatus Eremiobacteraeota bacterium]